MTLGRAHVDASTPGVADLVGELIDFVVDSGGAVHPQARVVERAGALSVHLEGDAGDEPLLRVPESLLVPVDDLEWDPEPDRIAVVAGDAGLSDDQRHALAAMVRLYEVTGKAVWAQRSLPGCALTQSPRALAAVRRAAPSFGARQASVAEVFISSRVYRYRPDPQGPSTRILFPVIDLVDHHRLGSPLRVRHGAMTVGVARPDDPTSCRVSYGNRRSPMATALHFGFVDTSAVHAASLRVELPADADGPLGVGVVVEGHSWQAVSPLDPPAVRFDDGRVRLSHLTFDSVRPHRLPVILALALAGLDRRGDVPVPDPESAARWLLGAVARRNVEVLDEIAGEFATDAAAPPAWSTVVGAAQLQRQLIAEAASSLERPED